MENENNNYEQPDNQQPQYDQQPYGQQPYGQQPYYNMNNIPTDKNGQPLKNRFGMKLTFSILEILCCNMISLVCGIIGCVFTSKANNSYKEGRWEEFKTQAKGATIALWIGFAGAMLTLIIGIVVIVFSVMLYNSVSDSDIQEIYDAAIVDEEIPATIEEILPDIEDEITLDTESGDMASPYEKITGEGFSDPSITIDGIYVQLPLTYADLKALGLTISEEDEDYVINPNEYDDVSLYNAEGKDIGYVYVGNVTEKSAAMQDGVVFGFWFTDDNINFSLNNGLNQDSTMEEVIFTLGEPDYYYGDDESDYKSCQWYSHSDKYEDMEDNSLSIDFWEDKIDSIEVRYIGWE